ncbi:MAG: hypothetical protein ACLFUY_09820 [Desulfobacterales bacterium]
MSEERNFLEKQKAQLEQWSKHLAQLRLRARKMQVEASVKFENAFEELRDRIEAAQGKFESMAQGGEETREEIRSRVNAIWEDLKKALEKVNSRLK